MQLLDKQAITDQLASQDENTLFIDPLLDEDQIGAVSVDLRLGYDFYVSVLTRTPYINLRESASDFRDTASYFQLTRREIGETFVLYPGQVALSTTLEYLSLPDSVYADVLTRSSYTRLGIHMNTMIQPGFRGCFPIELFNHSNNAVKLIVGSRVFQSRLFELDASHQYGVLGNRKYFGNVRPVPSQASSDKDFPKLEMIRENL